MAALSSRVILGVILIVIIVGIIGYYIATQRAPVNTPTPTPTTPTPTVVTPTQTPTPTPPKVEVKAIRIGTTEAGTIGYIIGSVIASELKKMFPEVDISTYPVGGWPINMAEFVKGNLELPYTGTGTALALAWKREPPFDTLPPDAKLPVHTLALWSNTFCIAMTPELKDKLGIKTWRDLDGKKVSIFASGWISHRLIMKALETLGIKVSHVELGVYSSAQVDALRRGDIVAIGIHAGADTPAPGALEILAKMDLVIINPSPEDTEKVIKAGLPFDWVPVTAVNWTKPVGVDRMFCLRDWSAWVTTSDILPEDFVYKMLKNLIANKDKLLEQHKYFKEFAGDPIGVQVKAISSAPHVPVHPGLAKLLKEYGVWRPEWKIAGG
jgi:TRAP transporter TAXI family solute receptor